MPISLQTGIREYNGDLSQYTGMLGGLTPDVHTLRSLNPETTNRVICVMYRGPYFLMHYFGDGTNAYTNKEFTTYKKLVEYYNTGIQVNAGDHSLASVNLQGGFASRSIPIPTQQNANNNQTLQITIPELVGRPAANFHNMWIDGIADEITGLTHYQGLVAGSVDENKIPQRIFTPASGVGSGVALEPSPAWEVAEFLIIALDRSGARVEGAIMALGCIPQAKVGYDLFNSNASGTAALQTLTLSYNCQFVESAYVNDLAARYVQQFAVFGNKLNYNPGAGDAFFTNDNPTTYGDINTDMFNKGKRPDLDAVQSGVGNIPVFKTNNRRVQRNALPEHNLEPADHSRIYNDPNGTSTDISNPYESNAAPGS
jgi:hypothetical protein